MNISVGKTISLCMIVRNEEQHIGQCLNSVKNLVDEIIVVDTGSTDSTKEIAASFGARIYNFNWEDDFSAARNFGIEQATARWIMVLDGDEFLESAATPELSALVNGEDGIDAYLLPIKNLLSAEPSEWQTSLVLRLFRNTHEFRFQGKIHEQVIVPVGKRVVSAEQGPFIIHVGYQDNRRTKKNQRNFRMLKEALALDQENPYNHFYLSTEYIINGQYLEAEQHLKIALKGIPKDVLLFRAGAIRNAVICLSELNKDDEALDILNSELECFDNFPDYYFYLGNIFRKKSDLETAIAYYSKALSVAEPPLVGCSISGSNGYKSLYYQGLCLEEMQRHYEAIESYRASLEVNSSFWPALANLVQCLLYLSDGKTCLNYLAQNFRIVTGSPLLLITRLLLAAGYPACALSLTEKHLLPDDDTSSQLLGEIWLALGEDAKAEKFFSKVAADSLLYPTSLVLLCISSWRQNKPAGRKTLAKLTAIHENSPVIPALIKRLNSLLMGRTSRSCPKLLLLDCPECLRFGKELLKKFLELQMYNHALILTNQLIEISPDAKWQFSYYYWEIGRIAEAQQLITADNTEPKDAVFYLEMAKLHERLSSKYKQKICVLPNLLMI